jgi:beta-glucanase (GH16 family)
MVRSHKTFRYGYFEARVKLPSGKGLWPAFWLNSDYDKKGRLSWPPEIDIFEYVVNGESEQPDMIHANVAVSETKAQDGSWIYSDKNFNRRWNYYKAPFDMSKDWHTYGLLWEPGSVTVFLDGKKLFEKRYLWVYEDGAEAGPAHILLNLAVGGPWAGKNGIDDSAFPAELQVDYVRACQRSESSSNALCAGSKFTPPP